MLLLSLPGAGMAQTLMQLYQKTLETNPGLKIKEYTLERAQAQKDLALSKLLPQLAAIGNYSLNDFHQQAGASGTGGGRLPSVSAQYDGFRGTMQLRQALFDLASYYGWRSADDLVLQSQDEWDAARLAVAGDLIDRYLQVLQAGDEIDYVDAEMQAADSQLKRLRRMHERQLATVTDLYEVEAYRQSLRTREIEARNARQVALEKLRALSGEEVRDVAALTREALPPVPGTGEQWIEDAIRNNPGLTALRHAIDAADKMVTSNQAQHLPQVSLTLSETYSDLGFDNRTQPPYTVGNAGVQFVLPLYEGGRVNATVRDSRARHRMAQAQFEQMRRDIVQQTRTAYLDAIAAQARIESTGEEVRAQQKSVDAREHGYELGVTTIVDLLDSRRRFLKARTERSKARYDYIRALVGLRIRAGSLNDQDIEDISRWMEGSYNAAP